MIVRVKRNWFVLILNKPKGLLSTPLNGRPNLQDRCSSILKTEFKALNRLDYNASGLVSYCNSSRLIRQIRMKWSKSVRHYMVLTSSSMLTGTHAFHCLRNGHKVSLDKRGIECRSTVLSSRKIGSIYLNRIRNQTGFTHQVRMLAKHLGTHVIGDQYYSPKRYGSVPGKLYLEAVLLKLPILKVSNQCYSIHSEMTISLAMKGKIIDSIRQCALDHSA